MPYYVDNPSPLAQIAGLAAAYFRYKNIADTQKQENERLKLESQEAQARISEIGTNQAIARQAAGFKPGTDVPEPTPQYAPPPTPQKGKPVSDTDMFHYYMNRYGQAVQAKDPNAPSYMQLAQQYSLGADRESNEAYRTSEAQFIKGPKTELTEAQIKNTSGKFQHDIDMLRMRGLTQEQVARIHAAYRRAGGGRGGTGTAAAAAEQRAMYAALNEAARYGVNAQNQLQDSIYRYGADLHASDPTNENYPAPTAPQVLPMPVYIPGPGGQPIQIMVNPSGQIQQPSAPARSQGAPQSAKRSQYPPGTTATIGGHPVVMGRDGQWHPEGGGFGRP